jgi:hypothetical protein
MSRQDVINRYQRKRKQMGDTYQKFREDIDNLSEDTLFSFELIHEFTPLHHFHYSDYVHLLKSKLSKLEKIPLTKKWSDEINQKIVAMMNERGSMSILSKLDCEWEVEDEIRMDAGEIQYQNKRERIVEIKRQCEKLIVEYSYFCLLNSLTHFQQQLLLLQLHFLLLFVSDW